MLVLQFNFLEPSPEFLRALRDFNSKTNSNLSIDDFERHGRDKYTDEVSWSAVFNPKDGKLYKNDSDANEANASNQQKSNAQKSNSSISVTSVDSAAKFLEENADNWTSYQYGDLEGDPLEKKFSAAEKFIKTFKQFHGSNTEEAEKYQKKMENKGYKVVDVGESDYIFIVLKKPNK